MFIQLESTCLEGTVLKGLNIYEGKQDPVAMADEKYPDWLWSILVEPTTKFAEDEKFSK
ncbi:39S ribosomal protein L37, mitochondrial, partial [Lobulomyces angularis]